MSADGIGEEGFAKRLWHVTRTVRDMAPSLWTTRQSLVVMAADAASAIEAARNERSRPDERGREEYAVEDEWHGATAVIEFRRIRSKRRPKVCPVCHDGACETKSSECGK